MFPTFYPQFSSNLRKLSNFFPHVFPSFPQPSSSSTGAEWRPGRSSCVFSDVPPPRYQDREPTPPRGSRCRWISGDFFGGKRNWLGTWEKCNVSWLLSNVDQLLIKCWSWFIMKNPIYPYHIPPCFVDSWWIVQCLPLVQNEEGRLVCSEMTSSVFSQFPAEAALS